MTLSLNELSENEYWFYNNATYQAKNNHYKVEVDVAPDLLLPNYKEIHRHYLSLFNHEINDALKLEALKRLIFLNWYSFLEPPHFTGIEEIDVKSVFDSYAALNRYIIENKLDGEFTWMLKYYSCWEYIIFEYSKDRLRALTNFVKAVDTSVINFPKHALPKGTMNSRGQMGIYWKDFVEVI